MSAVTAISSTPMWPSTATYMAVSTAVISVGPESTLPGRNIHFLNGSRTRA